MGAEDQVAHSTLVKCGACNEDNHADAKFCKGCGQTLYEPCVACGKAVLLTQKFCGSCGADLEKAFQERHDQYEHWLSDAVGCTKQHEFERAIGLLNRVAEVTDYRFKGLSDNAGRAVAKVQDLKARAEQSRDDAIARAKAAQEQGDNATVIQLLEGIPATLLGDDGKRILAKARAHIGERTALETEVREGITAKNWSLVGSLLNQLIDMAPDEKQYARLANQVAEKLTTSAQRALGKGDYANALSKLNAVPTVGHSEQYRALLDSVGDAHWLAEQFSAEPFATPLLGRLAVRFAKAAPEDPQAKKIVSEIAVQLKQGERDPRSTLARWKGTNKGWMGGDVAVLGIPQSIHLNDQAQLRSHAGRFTVAYGLAMQGLGNGRVSEHFGPKKGLLGSLRKKKSRCWGLDIGSASVKAVLLEEVEGQLTAIDSFFEELPTPLCRNKDHEHEQSRQTIVPVVERFLAAKEVDGIPVWINLPEAQTVNRFVRLPPVKDKQAQTLLDREIEQKIPIPTEELRVVRWIADVGEDSVHGRSALITVVRSKIVDDRIEMLTDTGLQVAGVQSDAVALVNFATIEFEHLMDGEEVSTTEETPTVAMLDCGASGTTLTLVSKEAHWSWTLESGGEDLTGALARGTKMTRSDAEKRKRNPAELESPAKQYELAEQKLDELRSRLETALADAKRQNKRFRVDSIWCFGGGCLAHEWIRRVTLDS